MDRIRSEVTSFYSARNVKTLSGKDAVDGSIQIVADSEDVSLAVQLIIRSVNPKSVGVESRRRGDYVTIGFDVGGPIQLADLAVAELLLRLWDLTLGSTDRGFTVTGRIVQEENEPSTGEDLSTKDVAVLVVDDDDSLRELLVDILESRHMTVYACGAVREAVEILNSKRLDILISDYGLPKQTGAELAKIVKKKQPSTPVILISGWGSDLTLTAEERRNVDYVLSKPFNLQEVLETFDRCVQSLGARHD